MANKITTLFQFQESGLKRIKQEMASVDGVFGKMRAGFKASVAEFRSSTGAQVAAVGALVVGATKAIGAASDLEESVNAVTVTYGENAEAVLAIGENAATAFGMSKAEFNSFAVSFAGFAKKIADEQGRDVADVMKEIATRTADVASVMNLDLATASQLFQSTMAGSSEVARQYGYDVSAAAVEQRLLKDGLVESKSAITETDKVLGRYLVLMDESRDASGDFANTSDSLANSQRSLGAEMEDLQAEIGQALVPAVELLVTALKGLNDAFEFTQLDHVFEELGNLETRVTGAFRHLRGALDPAARANHEFAESVADADKWAQQFDMSLLANAKSGAEVREIVRGLANEEFDDLTAVYQAANVVALRWNDSLTYSREGVRFLNRDIIIANRSLEDHTETVSAAADAVDRLKREFDDGRQALDELTRSLEAEQGMQRLIDQLQQASEEGGFTAQEIRDLKLEVINYGDKVGGLPPSVTTDIVALIDEGAYLEALRKLDVFTQARIAPVVSIINPQTGSQYDGPRAHGGPTQAGKFYKVNENGSELLTEGGTTYLMAGSNGKVTPLDKAGSVGVGGGNTYNITVQTLAVTADTKRVLAEAVADIERDRKGML